MESNAFCERLKELRLEKGYSQLELSKMLNVSKMCVCHWEKGRSEPSIQQIVALSQLLESSTDYLLGKSAYYEL